MTFTEIVMFILFIVSIIILLDKADDGKTFLSLIFIIGLLIHNGNKADSYKKDINYYEDIIKSIIVTQDINLSKINDDQYKKTIITLQAEIEKSKLSADTNRTKQ